MRSVGLIAVIVVFAILASIGAWVWLAPPTAPPPQLPPQPPLALAARPGNNTAAPPAQQVTNQPIREDTIVQPVRPTIRTTDQDLPLIQAHPASSDVAASPQPAAQGHADEPAVPAAPAQFPPGKPRLAIIPLKHMGNVPETEKDAGKILADLLLAEIDSDAYDLYERSQIESLLTEKKFQASDLADKDALATAFGRLGGIRYLVIGSLNRLGTEYSIAARVVDCADGKISQRGSVSFASIGSARQALPELVNLLGLRRGNGPAAASARVFGNDLLDAHNRKPAFALNVRTAEDKAEYAEGEYISFSVEAERDCFVTLITRDNEGNLTLLLPNAWQRRAFVRKGERVLVPSPDAGFKFSIKPPHGETFVKAIATLQPLVLEGVNAQQIARDKFVGLSKGVKAIGVEGDAPPAQNAPPVELAGLLKDRDWATAELSVITRDKNAPRLRPQDTPGPASSGGMTAGADDPNERLLARYKQLNEGPVFVLGLATGPRDLPPPAGVLTIRRAQPLPGAVRFQSISGRIEHVPLAGDGIKSLDAPDLLRQMNALRAQPDVVAVIPNVLVHAMNLPPTHYMPVQWALQNPFGPANTGWERIADQAATLTPPPIGVVDMGLNLDDPRLAALAWRNPGEIPNNGIDDDNNGLVDDVSGYNFVANSAAVFEPEQKFNHGSMCSSIIAARSLGRSDDVVGIAPRAQIIAVVALNGEGKGDTKAILQAIAYAADRGAKVINLSLGGRVTSLALAEINKAPLWDVLEQRGVILVCAAGNDAADNDEQPCFPACLPRSNIISVMAVDCAGRLGRAKDKDGQWRTFSNYGRKSVHIAAPGSLVLGIPAKDQTNLGDGTSYAAPIVTGAVALVMAKHPDWDHRQVIQAILESATLLPELKDKCVSGGMVNIAAALQWTAQPR